MVDVTSFTGEYAFLSNFYPCIITTRGYSYNSVEHAYQASKTMNEDERKLFRAENLSAAGAKKLGQNVTIRANWDEIKIPVMYNLVLQKFTEYDRLRSLLLKIDGIIIEGNYWKDTFWGECPLGNGKNHLGKILMRVRDELK